MTAPSYLAYLGGRFLPVADAHLTLHDAGFVMGATVTDLCRTFGHQLFRLDDHLQRFRKSCGVVQIPLTSSDDELKEIAGQLVANNSCLLTSWEQELALVLFATPGPIGYYLGEPGGLGDAEPTLGMHTLPIPFSRYAALFHDGARLIVPPTRHVPTACVPRSIKQRSRLHWRLAQKEVEAIDRGASALLLDERDHVTETAAANFLIVRGGAVLTPPRGSVLDGVSLRVVAELCAEHGISFEEQPLTVADCLTADEAMLSSTTFCLAGVRSIDGVALAWPGPIFTQLLAAWSAQVGVDIGRQILSNR